MSADPTIAPDCTCPWTVEEVREYDPNCPEHGCEPVLEAPSPYCCDHDPDAHDGMGCLDCACMKAPWSRGYAPRVIS